ncbi:EF-hand and coiled-coil domain-containing protein 1 isoform X3 [Catharus ustulatus]|uniref:EF-hand and coiled-coil domain-containing protein 1 isoform X3 n=1 Tax=Catharus ustulatus TaxID=91951 RepID=UPI00140DE9AD|nr:EF-hand and coiled-coil domain-containing protein 1 isoform X3 [Catharus ustulatus]
MEPPEGWDPYGRPARRTQWLVSALAYHYGLDRGVENEIVVLATGLDQYLQEIFHHLDCAGAGRIPSEDFRTLCQVLGLEEAAEPEEGAGLWDGLSAELTFRQFHARLCGHFSTRAGPRLPLGRESEHIETQIRLRSPRRRRCRARPAEPERRPPGPCCRERSEEMVALEQAEERLAKLQEENGSLRELVEDMRAALQSSDARCLALQVGLRKSHASHKEEGSCFLGSKRPLAQKHSQTKCLQSVLKEKELICSSRDGQLEEAIRFNQELEKELQSSQEALVSLEDCNRNLKREQAEMRRKVEEARHTVLTSLGKVKELEVRANEVPHLQGYIQHLESQLQHYRCDERTRGKLLSYLETSSTNGKDPGESLERISPVAEQPELKGLQETKSETNMEEVKGPLLEELQQKVEETEMLKMELQMLETERVRLSLVEEKLMDVLKLLQKLQDLNISKRALGKILLSTLESCRDPQPGKAQLFEVLDTLQQELTACELLHKQPMEQAQSPRSLSNPLVISC